MIRFFYNLLFPVGLLVFLPAYLLKMRRRGNYRRNFGQRFALYSPKVRSQLAGRSATWIHAVSVGEVAIALKLAAKMRQLDPAFTCILTTTTTTGYAVAERDAPPWLHVLYNPLDFLPVVRRAFAVIRPTRIILVEAEIWPNLVAEARRRAIPIALVNARLSPRSERRFRRFRALVAPTFRCLDLVCVQEAGDVARWQALGVDATRIRRVGSIKYDPVEAILTSSAPLEFLQEIGIASDAPILFGGSTHAGEERILAEVALQLRREFPALFLIIAPRHVERVAEIRLMLEELGLSVAQRTAIAGWRAEPVDCLLLDSTGELRDWYAAATAVFVGKSLTTRGGQNPVEPILADKPVVFGPHMENFAVLASALVAEAGAVQVADARALQSAAGELLRDPAVRGRMVANAQRVIAAHRGATDRTAELLRDLRSTALPCA
ncbi:MAG: 3-deoxy-D-manno-octulosonic acid transferase [Chthoniobacterales bacterium]